MTDDRVEPGEAAESEFVPASELPSGYGRSVVDADGKERLQDPAATDGQEAAEEVGYPLTDTTPRSVFGDRSAGGPV